MSRTAKFVGDAQERRHGTLAYLAALDIGRRAKASRPPELFGRCEPKVAIEPFGRLVERVTTQEPYASAPHVFWIVDNGSSHAGKAWIERLEGAWQNLRLIHLPYHASWLNQIEIYFSILQRKALTPKDFPSLAALAERITRFQAHWQRVAEPFGWNFTRRDLDALMARLAGREPQLRLAA
jgi:hypothetical protein